MKHEFENIYKFVEQHVPGPWIAKEEPIVLYRTANSRFVITYESCSSFEGLWRSEVLRDHGIDDNTVDAEEFGRKFVDRVCMQLSPHDMMYLVNHIQQYLDKWNEDRVKAGYERYMLTDNQG